MFGFVSFSGCLFFFQVFFVIILNSQTDASQSLNPIIDSDPLISCNLMDDRNAFLSMAKDNHHEFSSLRRAKYSTLAMLYEIHINGRNNSLLTCNNCKTRVEALWHCTVCKVRFFLVNINYAINNESQNHYQIH